MKRGTVVLFALIAALSVFLLWLWYYLGFSRAGSYLEVALSIVWWAAIALLMYGLYRVEKHRRQLVRTIYVSPTALYNSERGIVQCSDPSLRVQLMEDILDGLQYSFAKPIPPEGGSFDFTHIVHTDSFGEGAFKRASSDDGFAWTGTVTKIVRQGFVEESIFDNRTTLASAVA